MRHFQAVVTIFRRKVVCAPHHEDKWESGGIASIFLTPAVDADEWLASLHGRFTIGESAQRKSERYGIQKKILALIGN